MQETTLRKWHRNVGIVLAPFVLLQVVSGIFLSLGFLSRFQDQVHRLLQDYHLPSLARFWNFLLMEIHSSGGIYGALYNLLIASGLITVLLSGIIVYMKVQGRQRRRAIVSGANGAEASPWNGAAADAADAYLLDGEPSFRRRKYRVYTLLGLWALATLSLMTFSFYTTYQMGSLHVPLVHHVDQIRIDVTRGHLWLEGFLAGDSKSGQEKVSESFERIEKHIAAVLEGAETPEGVVLPLESIDLRRRMEGIRTSLNRLRVLALQISSAPDSSNQGSAVSREYDRLFEGVLASARGMEVELLASIRHHQDQFLTAQILLVGCTFAFGFITLIAFSRYEEARRLHLEELVEAHREAKTQEHFFSQMIQHVADPFIVISDEGRVLDANRTACLSMGYSRKEMLECLVSELEAEHPQEELMRIFGNMEPGAPVALRATHRRKDGTTYPVVCDINVLEWEGKRLFLCLSREVA